MNATDHGPRNAATPNARHARTTASAIASRAGSSPLAIGRSRFTGCSRSCASVADVVREVRRARRRAVRDEGDAGLEPQRSRRRACPRTAGRRTGAGSSSTGAAATRRARRARPSAVRRRRSRPSGGCVTQVGRADSRAAAGRTGCPSQLALELDAPAERDRQLAGDRQTRAPCRRRRATRTAGRSARWSDGLIPGPVSATETETVPFAAASASSTRPPSGVHRKALESRLETIWSTRSPSETITGAPSLSQR